MFTNAYAKSIITCGSLRELGPNQSIKFDKGIVQRIRNFVLNKVKELVLQALSYIMTNFLKQVKDSIIAAVIDQIFCAFENIVGYD